MAQDAQSNENRLIELTADVVSAYVSHNSVPVSELTALVGKVYAVLKGMAGAVVVSEELKELKPAVPIKKSIHPDYIISLEDGKKFKSLKRHLSTRYGLSPDEYRAKWDLPADYPMVAPNYAASRSALAKTMGLGRKHEKPLPAKRTRKKTAV